MSWVKGDGALIKITFDKNLIGSIESSGNEVHFTVTAKEYLYVPEGPIQNVVKSVESVYAGDTPNEIILEMADTDRFNNAMQLTVAYDGLGTLAGASGNVETFSQTFVPTDLIYDGDQNDAEHIEIGSISPTGVLTRIYYTDIDQNDLGHIEISSITATGLLTHINDI